MVLLPTSSKTFAINSPQLLLNVFAASGFKDLQQACNLEQTSHAALHSPQTQCPVALARDLERFQQGRDSAGVNIGRLGQIYDDGFRWLTLQHSQKPI